LQNLQFTVALFQSLEFSLLKGYKYKLLVNQLWNSYYNQQMTWVLT